MSYADYPQSGQLRFWTEEEIELRELAQYRIVTVVKNKLLEMNKAWRFVRTEGPCLTPVSFISPEYDETSVFHTNKKAGGELLALRAETTASSYEVARRVGGKLPLCIWQSGKSFRPEEDDGASPSKMRFKEFWQLEFQCIYSESTKANYREGLIPLVCREINRVCMRRLSEIRVVDSDRLPSYSENTRDIEVYYNDRWTEVASCSIRNDFDDGTKVTEIAVGLDRLATIAHDCYN